MLVHLSFISNRNFFVISIKKIILNTKECCISISGINRFLHYNHFHFNGNNCRLRFFYAFCKFINCDRHAMGSVAFMDRNDRT